MTPEETQQAEFQPTIDFFRHPVNNEPYLFVLGTDRYPVDRRLCLMTIDGLLETGRRFEAAGQLASAEGYYRHLLSLFPDSVGTRAALARLLAREARHIQ
jgi:hypothetical protein